MQRSSKLESTKQEMRTSTEHDARLPETGIPSTNMPRNINKKTILHSTGHLERIPQHWPIRRREELLRIRDRMGNIHIQRSTRRIPRIWKFQFGEEQVKALGFYLTQDGIEPTDAYILGLNRYP